jgi:hypothetical protein
MNTILNKAIKLAQEIQKKYNELNNDNENFFDLYHDDLLIQSDCAWQEVEELEEDLKNKQKEYAEISMQNLKDTLIYVTFIIDIQNQLNNCPKSIYG